MWIVKLGGSLWGGGDLRRWLAALALPAAEARLVVPGGGPFADAVRAVQPVLDLSDLAAHRMALLAMQQYGTALLDLEPGLRPVEDLAEAGRLRRERAAGIWLPWQLAAVESGIEASWRVTSDSLAAWLATRLLASTLLLVKAALPERAPTDPARLAASGLVDAAFPEHRRAFAGPVFIAPARHCWRPEWCVTLPSDLLSVGSGDPPRGTGP